MTFEERLSFTRKMRETFVPDTEAQEAVWVHAVDCCASVKNVLEMIESDDSKEICCSRPNDPKKFWGAGLLLKGQVNLMFTEDANSDIAYDTEERLFSFYDSEEDDEEVDESYLEGICRSSYSELKPSKDGKWAYTESWVCPKEVVGVFVCKEQLNTYKTKKSKKALYNYLIELAGGEDKIVIL